VAIAEGGGTHDDGHAAADGRNSSYLLCIAEEPGKGVLRTDTRPTVNLLLLLCASV